ncbi:MAG: hypothetical protein GXO77_10470 [Calditrichaeota bacterium]|nr:hypothetical protein [Calditrichota bacterium]
MNFFQNVFLRITFIAVFFVAYNENGSAQTVTVAEIQCGECELRLEADPKWEVLTVRARHPEFKLCDIDKESLLRLLNKAFTGNDSLFVRQKFNSVFLGRIVEYPWLSEYLALYAKNDANWSLAKGRPVKARVNDYVASALTSDTLLYDFKKVFAKINYEVLSVSVEKVLVGSCNNIPRYSGLPFKGKIPFDAQIYLILKRKK